jgi:excisionase family DNA binding protein
MKAVDTRPMLTPQELAEHLRLPLQTIYDWRKKGTGPIAIKVGKHLRYRWADLEKWLDAQAGAAA